MNPLDALIIPAAGHGDRYGKDKLTEPLMGLPLFAHALKALAPFFSPERRLMAVAPDRLEEFRRLMEELPPDCRAIPVPGGDTRFHSVCAALKQLPGDTRVVVVHDAARPLIAPAMVELCIEKAQEKGAAVVAHPVTDTIKVASKNSLTVKHTPDRATLWAAETPQAARYDLFSRAFQHCLTLNISPTDDVQAVELLGVEPVIVPNHAPNPKITFPADLLLAESLLNRQDGHNR